MATTYSITDHTTNMTESFTDRLPEDNRGIPGEVKSFNSGPEFHIKGVCDVGMSKADCDAQVRATGIPL